MEDRNEEIAQKAKEKREQHLKERQRQLENYEEAGWSAMTELEDLQRLETELGGQCEDVRAVNTDDEEDDDYVDELFCVACNKAFKSEKAFVNHAKSKKRKENVVALQEDMRKEDEDLVGVDQEVHGMEADQDIDSPEEEAPSKQKLSKKQKKKKKQQNLIPQDVEDINNIVDNLELSDAPAKQSTKSKKERRKEKEARMREEKEAESSLKQESQEVNSPLNKEADSTADRLTGNEPENSSTTKPESCSESTNRKGKNKTQTDQEMKCNVCHEVFPTRNKLFTHIKEKGHALRVDQPSSTSQGKRKKNKK